MSKAVGLRDRGQDADNMTLAGPCHRWSAAPARGREAARYRNVIGLAGVEQ